MRYLSVFLTALLVAASLVPAAGEVQLRYNGLSGPVSLTVEHDITLQMEEPLEASRNLTFTLSPAADPGTSSVVVTIDSGRAGSMAHGMTQRLGTRHLEGRSFPLSIVDQERRLAADGADGAPAIDLGPMVPGGLAVADLLADALPVLPQEAVATGATWTIEREVRTLEGWAWATGRLISRHSVAAVDRREDRTVVSVATEAEARLGPVAGGRGYSGRLTRTLRWSFDASAGRLLALTMDQETEGVSSLKGEETPVRQVTRLRMSPSDSAGGS